MAAKLAVQKVEQMAVRRVGNLVYPMVVPKVEWKVVQWDAL